MDKLERRYVPFEYRASEGGPGELSGTLLRWGDRAQIGPSLTEEFKPGAFGDLSGRIIRANRMHQRLQPLGTTKNGRLKLVNDDESLRVVSLQLPNTTAGRDADVEVREELLTGFSVEFGGAKDNISGGHRVIESATLGGLGVVDVPAYPGSLLDKRWDNYRSEYGLWAPETEDEPVVVPDPVVTSYRMISTPVEFR